MQIKIRLPLGHFTAQIFVYHQIQNSAKKK